MRCILADKALDGVRGVLVHQFQVDPYPEIRVGIFVRVIDGILDILHLDHGNGPVRHKSDFLPVEPDKINYSAACAGRLRRRSSGFKSMLQAIRHPKISPINIFTYYMRVVILCQYEISM